MNAADGQTGRWGTSVWVSVAAEQYLHGVAAGLPKGGGRGADRRIASSQRLVLADYCDYVESFSAEEDEPCFVGTLIAYPGAQSSGTRARNTSLRYDRPGRTSRINETAKPGSKRMFLSPQVRDLAERALPHGLVLEGQTATPRPTDSATPSSSEPTTAQVGRRGRPLTDVVMTAIALKGRLTDDPLAGIQHQVLSKKLARALWACAGRDVDEGRPQLRRRLIQQLLEERLPALLAGDSHAFSLLNEVAGSWMGSLTGLAERLDELAAQSRHALQLSLFSDMELS